MARHIAEGGVSRFLYGGNAFLYHVSLAEYEQLLDWLAGFPADRWAIPSLGPSFGRAIDQAPPPPPPFVPLRDDAPLRRSRATPGHGGRPARDRRRGRPAPRSLYLKSEDGFGSDKERGLDAVGRLVADGVCVAVKYAVVRDDPGTDAYLDGLLRRVDRARVVSGIGERPAVVHLRDFGLAGMTTGSGCIAPRLSNGAPRRRASRRDWARAETLWADFKPLEDLRDGWGPARVLHHATELAGIARTGPIPPFVSALERPSSSRRSPPWRGPSGRRTREPAQDAGRPPQPPLVRQGRPALVRPPLAGPAAGLRRRRLCGQAGHRHPQHLERREPLPRALPACAPRR